MARSEEPRVYPFCTNRKQVKVWICPAVPGKMNDGPNGRGARLVYASSPSGETLAAAASFSLNAMMYPKRSSSRKIVRLSAEIN